jgi:hypothetical protein
MILYCKHCSNKFEAQRKSAKYCSDACRVAWHRLKKDIDNQFYDARFAIRSIINLMDYDHLTLRGDKHLTELANEINNGRFGDLMRKIIDLENGTR